MSVPAVVRLRRREDPALEWLAAPVEQRADARDLHRVDADSDELTWFIDGSLYDEPWRFARRTGFGIVVVSRAGSLVACGSGRPPHWVHDAAGAEIRAFPVVTRMTTRLPRKSKPERSSPMPRATVPPAATKASWPA